MNTHMGRKITVPVQWKGDAGLAFELMMLWFVIVLAAAALTIDLGYTLYQQRRMQVAADAAALAAVELLNPEVEDSQVTGEATAVAGANGLYSSEIGVLECGQWKDHNPDDGIDRFTFAPCSGQPYSVCTQCAEAGVNAVRIGAIRSVATRFAGVIGVRELFPPVTSVAVNSDILNLSCLRPFGVELSFLDDPEDPKEVGDTLYLNSLSAGNWGKIDLGGLNMSSGVEFCDGMLNGLCGLQINLGDIYNSGPGFGGNIPTCFEPVVGQEMIFSAVTEFDHGSNPIEILEFFKIRYEGYHGNGNNWESEFTLIERDVDLEEELTASSHPRILVQ